MTKQYILYEPQLHIMICLSCKKGITKNGIARHYRKHHRNMSLRMRKAIAKYSDGFKVYTNQEFQYPRTVITRIEDIMTERGLRCLYMDCNHACICPTSMEEHCKTKHGWTTLRGTTG